MDAWPLTKLTLGETHYGGKPKPVVQWWHHGLCAGPAFFIGLLYGNLEEVYNLIASWDKDKIINAYLDAPQKGFNTQLMGKDLFYWASTLLEISRKGLDNRDILNKSGKNETLFLNHLQKVIDNKTTSADHMIDKFSKNEDLKDLYDK